MTAPTRIDAHHHVWDLQARPQPWTDGLPALQRSFHFPELVPQLDAAGVLGTVVVHTVADAEETRELLALAAEQPRVLGVVGWLDLTDPRLADVIGAFRSLPGGDLLVGVRHQLQVEPDRRWIDRTDVRRSLSVLGAHDLTYDLVVSPEQLPDVLPAVDAAPDTRFVLDHAGKPDLRRGDLAGWERSVRDLAARDNVTVKLSGLVTEADWQRCSSDDLRPAVDAVLDAFGPGRTMWGSDWPVSLLAGADYARWVHVSEELLAGLSTDEADAVWHDSARRTYQLTDGVTA